MRDKREREVIVEILKSALDEKSLVKI